MAMSAWSRRTSCAIASALAEGSSSVWSRRVATPGIDCSSSTLARNLAAADLGAAARWDGGADGHDVGPPTPDGRADPPDGGAAGREGAGPPPLVPFLSLSNQPIGRSLRINDARPLPVQPVSGCSGEMRATRTGATTREQCVGVGGSGSGPARGVRGRPKEESPMNDVGDSNCVAVFDRHEDAEGAIRALQKGGFDMKKLSI